jgi:hypothetical protein
MTDVNPAGEQGPDPTVADLQATVGRLEATMADLNTRHEVHAARPRRWRTVLAVALIVLGTLLTPVAVVGGWSRVLLTDTDVFVDTYAAVVRDATIQDFITAQTMDAIDAHLDIDGAVGEVVNGLSSALPNRPRLTTGLQALQGAAVQGVRSTIRQAVERVVASDAFTTAWTASLRLTHDQTTATLSGSEGALATVSADGLGIRLGPIVERVKTALVAQGFALASKIPAIDRTVILIHSDAFGQARLAYVVVVATGSWLPIVVLALLAGGVLAAARRPLATVWAATGLALGGLLTIGAVAIGCLLTTASASAGVPPAVVVLLYDTTVSALKDLATATVLLGVVVALIAWFAGPFRPARRIRSAGAGLAADLRQRADSAGLGTGRFGDWLFAHRRWVRALVAGLAVVVLVFNRPLTIGLVLGTSAVVLLALLVLALLSRPPADSPTP